MACNFGRQLSSCEEKHAFLQIMSLKMTFFTPLLHTVCHSAGTTAPDYLIATTEVQSKNLTKTFLGHSFAPIWGFQAEYGIFFIEN